MSTPTPAAYSGTTMSLNRMAASTPCRRTGCSVISQVSSGVRQACSMPVSARSARYSGSDRPACRMNQTGTCGRALTAGRGQQRRGARSRRRRRTDGGTAGPTGMGAAASGPWDTAIVTVGHAHVLRPDRRIAGAPRRRITRVRPRVPARARRDRPTTAVPAGGRLAARHAAAAGAAVAPLDAPPRLAPYTWAFSVEADAGRPGEDLDEPDTSGRLILLHDPAGQDAWEGTFRLVCFVQARLEPEQLGDEMLPVVGWSWLTEALELERRRVCCARRHCHADVLRPVRRHRRAAPRRRRRAARLLDPGRVPICDRTPRLSARWWRRRRGCPRSASSHSPSESLITDAHLQRSALAVIRFITRSGGSASTTL